MSAPEVTIQAGMHVELSLPPWLAREKGFASREVQGEVLRATARALFCRLTAIIRESDTCLQCGREIDNPASRVLGYGPICSDRLGLPHAETYAAMSPEEKRAVLAEAERVSTLETWLPLSQVVIRSAEMPHAAPEPWAPGDDFPEVGVVGAPPCQAHTAPPPNPRRITLEDGRLCARFPFDRALVDALKTVPGYKWDKDAKVWSWPVSAGAALLGFAETHGFHVEDGIRQRMEAARAVHQQNLAESAAADADFHVEGLSGTPYPFQRAGVRYMARNRRVILGDQPGLGKTIQGLALFQHLSAFPALVVVPATLKANWEREARRWLPGRTVEVLTGTKQRWLVPADITIINYELMPAWVNLSVPKDQEGKRHPKYQVGGPLVEARFRAILMDEAHLVKNHRAQRTVALMELSRALRAHHKAQPEPWDMVLVAATGTPVLNRVPELLAPLQIIDRLDDLGGWMHFARRYCGYDGTMGARRVEPAALEELNQRMRATCYVRRLKTDVLKELPAKVRTTVALPIDNRKAYRAAEQGFQGFMEGRRRAGVKLHQDGMEVLAQIQELKKLAAAGKMASIIRWIEDFLDSGEKLVVGAWHQEVVEQIAKHFRAPYIHGGVSMAERDRVVNLFQRCGRCHKRHDAHDGPGACEAYVSDPQVRLIVLNTKSGGVGLTLTAASDIAVVELPWTPGELDQLEDRIHRIGQRESANVWYLLGEGTIDEDVASLIDAKRSVVDAATDGEGRSETPSILEDLVKRLAQRGAA